VKQRLLALLLLVTSFTVFSANDQNQESENEQAVTQEIIDINRSEVTNDNTLKKPQRGKAMDFLGQATHWLRQNAKIQGKIKNLQNTIENAPSEIKKLRTEIEKSTPDDEQLDNFIKKSKLGDVEGRINQENLNLAQARERLKQQLDILSQLLVGSQQINDGITEHSRVLNKITTEGKSRSDSEPKRVSKAHQLLLQSKKQFHQSQVELLRLRLNNQNLLTNLVQAKRDATTVQIDLLQRNLAKLNTTAGNIREAMAKEARQEAERLQEETQSLPKPIQKIAQENAKIRGKLEELVYWEKRVSGKLTATQNQLEQVRSDFEHVKQRVEVVGTSKAIGKMLIRRRQELPSLHSYSLSAAQRRQEINLATDHQLDIEEQLLEWGDLNERVNKLAKTLAEDLSAKEAKALKKSATNLMGARRDALNELQKVYGRYITHLTSLDHAELELLEISNSYVAFINEQLIWIPSGDPFDLVDIHQLADSAIWMISPGTWLESSLDSVQAVINRPDIALAILVILTLMIWKRRQAKLQMPLLTKATRKIRTDSISLTVYALILTLVRIGIIPGFMIGLGFLLNSLPTLSPISTAVASALIIVGINLIGALLLYHLCLPEGIGIRHLRWNSDICQALTKELRWMIPTAIPLRFLAVLTSGENLPAVAQIVDRLTVIALMIITLVFAYRLLHKQNLLYQSWQRARPHGLLIQLHFLWFPLIQLVGISLLIASIMGYLTLSLRLLEHFELTFWFFVGFFTLKELLLRYLFIAERRLRYENALQRRDELRAQREQEQQHPVDDESAAISVEIPELDFSALSEQAKRLVRFGYLFGSVVGTWLIWAELLPALDFLNTVQFPFTTSQIVDGIVTEGHLTLSDVVIGLTILVVTFLAARNLPGVLEITILQRLPLETGARYALSTLLQYLIAGIGIIMAFSTIGFQWSSIQWLVAALSVGLGFGLQEIVANFISGIILLFERPIRVGDVITLDQTTGMVSRIRIRATTITNYDKQEMLIPNKEFITGRVINWTLSDKINRIIITVGVAYGTDVNHAMALLIEAAEETENVLADPKPAASFEAFGDNALTLLLRAYLSSMDNRIATITALHEMVYRKFNQAGIAIPFPQRDIHIIDPDGVEKS
jgi:potassium efflux system protein